MLRVDWETGDLLLECDDCHQVFNPGTTNLTKATVKAEKHHWWVGPDLKEHLCELCNK